MTAEHRVAADVAPVRSVTRLNPTARRTGVKVPRVRDDFSKKVIEAVARRVNYICSNPGCRAQTLAPHSKPTKVVSTGVASHITAASPGGPRHDPALSPDERRSSENAIWLCENCAKRVDADLERYPAQLLRRWKRDAELEADATLGQPRGQSSQAGTMGVAKAQLRDERIQRLLREWPRLGSDHVQREIGTFHDLSQSDKANLYETVYALYKRGRRPKSDPFSP